MFNSSGNFKIFEVQTTLETIFTLYIRPILEYADIIWSGAPQHLLLN